MRSPLLCLLTGAVIAGAIAVVYAVPWHVSSLADLPHLLGLRDHWLYYAPSAFFLDSALQRGELPLWNPLVSGRWCA